MLEAGIRIGDTIALQFDEIDLDAGERGTHFGYDGTAARYAGAPRSRALRASTPESACSISVTACSSGTPGAVQALAWEAHAAHPDRPLPCWAAIIGVVGGSDELTTRTIRSGDFAQLPRLVEPILELQSAVITP